MAGKEGGKEGASTLGKREFKLYGGCVGLVVWDPFPGQSWI